MNQLIDSLVKNDLNRVDAEFEKNLHSEVGLITKIGRHLLLSGGKRFRPMILILSARLCGYEGDRHITLAGIVEFIHTASLLHDDVVDDAALRRGNASANTLWGSEASVLVGDFLFSKSFALMVRDGDIRILQVISDATAQLAEGEIQELTKTSDLSLTEEGYISIVTRKTAALISAACQIGAILGQAPPQKEASLGHFGLNLGIAFQLMDDTLDYVANEEEFGKMIGIDLQDGKVTLPLIHALRNCTALEKGRLTDVFSSDNRSSDDFSFVRDVIEKYQGIDYTHERAEAFVQEAKAYLESFDASQAKTALSALADYVIERRT
jgi:octaprenyl-diphosphate synthase